MHASDYGFEGGFPTAEAVQKAYDDVDLVRAIEAYKFFYPTVSNVAAWNGFARAGAVPNATFLVLQGSPRQVVLTPNSDTPYAALLLDLSRGPLVVEFPAGPLISVVNDLHQRYVMDLGLPGPDAGKGGTHIILPPGHDGRVPPGYYGGVASTRRVLLLVRALPPRGDMQAAIALMKTVKVYPLSAATPWTEPRWLDMPDRLEYLSAFTSERNLEYWRELHGLIDAEPPFEPYRAQYGALASLGIAKGTPFAPDARSREILERAAQLANAQMRVQSFADRRPDRLPWSDRRWEWASLRYENGTFDLPSYKDLEAREKWFFQAVVESPAMFRRDAGAGSLYWLGLRDRANAFLDGSLTYKLTVPLPVPAKLFWSVTVYDPYTRSQIQTEQNQAALRSLVELQDLQGSSVDLYFGPSAPPGQERRWLQTLPDRGWFTYFRIYGPERPAFDGSWKPSDFVRVKQ